MRVSVVGLGPGPREWITPAALSRLGTRDARVFVRTRHFPALEAILDGLEWQSFDELYESASSLDEVHATIARRLLEAGDEVVLAVPGVGALAASKVAATSGAQVVEATALGGTGIDLLIELNPRWHAVVTGVFSPRIASDLKLALLRVYPPEHRVSLVRHPCLAEVQIEQLSLAELDRVAIELDHLTHVVLPPVLNYVPTGSSHTLRAIVAR